MRPLQPGMRLRAYRLEARLGGGHDGEVWRAADAQGAAVALKARRRDRGDPSHLRREYERLRALRLPSVVRVRDVGEDEGYLFFTMDLAEGDPFDVYVQRGATLAAQVQRAASAGAAVASALASIHRLGLAHRDLKPSNILVDAQGRPVLLDFGAASSGAVDEADGRAGTAAYMAPELRLGLPSDTRVDSYALGVTLHEALAGAAARTPPGRPRRPLLALGPAVPRALSRLVERALALDPAERPEAEDFAVVLSATAEGRDLPAAAWPSPATYVGDPAPLLAGSAVVVGPMGSGRRRMVEEARYQWHRRGYRSISGRCRPDEPFGGLQDILAALLANTTSAERRSLLGAEADLLRGLVPALGGTGAVPWPPAPVAVGQATARVLGRAAPLAVALWDVDYADAGTRAALPALARSLPSGVVLWATATTRQEGLRPLTPPPWGALQERTLLADLLPEASATTLRPAGAAGTRPLESCIRAWRVLAELRGERGPRPLPADLAPLALLEASFPLPLAALLCPPEVLTRAIAAGDLQVATDGVTARLADPGSRRLAAAALPDLRAAHGRIAQAWRRLPPPHRAPQQAASHALAAQQASPEVLHEAVEDALRQGQAARVERWLRLLDLQGAGPDDFLLAYARAWATLERTPAQLAPAALDALRSRARTPEHLAMVDTLRLMFIARRGDRDAAVQIGRQMAADLSARFPLQAAHVLREIAVAEQDRGEPRAAVEAGEAALRLLPPADAPTRQEVEVSDALAGALLCAGRPSDAATLSAELARRCAAHQHWRGEAVARAQLARGLLCLGQRAEAADHAARARRLQPRHSDLGVLARCAVMQARLAVERGELAAGRRYLDEALTAAEAVDAPALRAEAVAVWLEVALHTASREEAQAAIRAYSALPPEATRYDHGPAAIGRWYWLAGDVKSALDAVRVTREGYAALCVRVEQARLLLVSGRTEEANRSAAALTRRAASLQVPELALLARLIAGAATGEGDASYLPLLERTRDSRWVHLYLGGLHLDALRRRLRGENVSTLIRRLGARATSMEHRLYMALSRPDAW